MRGNNDDGLRFGIDETPRKLPQGTLRLGYLFYSPAANFGYQKGRMRGYSHEYNWAEHDVLPGNDGGFSASLSSIKQLAEQSAFAFRPVLGAVDAIRIGNAPGLAPGPASHRKVNSR